MKAVGLFIAMLGVTLLGAQAHAADYEPKFCAQTLQAEGLTPFEPRLPRYSQVWGGMYAPFQGVICRNLRTAETRFFPPSQFLAQCSQLHAQDPNWTMAYAYNCLGGAPHNP